MKDHFNYAYWWTICTEPLERNDAMSSIWSPASMGSVYMEPSINGQCVYGAPHQWAMCIWSPASMGSVYVETSING